MTFWVEAVDRMAILTQDERARARIAILSKPPEDRDAYVAGPPASAVAAVRALLRRAEHGGSTMAGTTPQYQLSSLPGSPAHTLGSPPWGPPTPDARGETLSPTGGRGHEPGEQAGAMSTPEEACIKPGDIFSKTTSHSRDVEVGFGMVVGIAGNRAVLMEIGREEGYRAEQRDGSVRVDVMPALGPAVTVEALWDASQTQRERLHQHRPTAEGAIGGWTRWAGGPMYCLRKPGAAPARELYGKPSDAPPAPAGPPPLPPPPPPVAAAAPVAAAPPPPPPPPPYGRQGSVPAVRPVSLAPLDGGVDALPDGGNRRESVSNRPLVGGWEPQANGQEPVAGKPALNSRTQSLSGAPVRRSEAGSTGMSPGGEAAVQAAVAAAFAAAGSADGRGAPEGGDAQFDAKMRAITDGLFAGGAAVPSSAPASMAGSLRGGNARSATPEMAAEPSFGGRSAKAAQARRSSGAPPSERALQRRESGLSGMSVITGLTGFSGPPPPPPPPPPAPASERPLQRRESGLSGMSVLTGLTGISGPPPPPPAPASERPLQRRESGLSGMSALTGLSERSGPPPPPPPPPPAPASDRLVLRQESGRSAMAYGQQQPASWRNGRQRRESGASGMSGMSGLSAALAD